MGLLLIFLHFQELFLYFLLVSIVIIRTLTLCHIFVLLLFSYYFLTNTDLVFCPALINHAFIAGTSNIKFIVSAVTSPPTAIDTRKNSPHR